MNAMPMHMARDIEDTGDKWCILRCSGSRTLALAGSLAEVGYDVWAPAETRTRLAGRKREMVEQQTALLPGYVFAPWSQMRDLLTLSRSPSLSYRVYDTDRRRMVSKGHPYFTVFQVRPQTDTSLAPLRALEESLAALAQRRREKAQHRGRPPQFKAGQIVSVGKAGFEGLRLVVSEDNAGKDVKLIHPDWTWPVEISAWKLQAIQVNCEDQLPVHAIAA